MAEIDALIERGEREPAVPGSECFDILVTDDAGEEKK